jgi:hypothetical protein
MSWIHKFPPFSWRAESRKMRKINAELLDDVRQLRDTNQRLLDEHRRMGEEAAKTFPINNMFSPAVEVVEDYASQIRTFRIQLRPVAVQYVLPYRHLALSEDSIQSFADHISDRIGREFSRLLTDDWVKQGVIKKL